MTNLNKGRFKNADEAQAVWNLSVEKVSGISTSTNWKAEVTDMLALVKFVAANPHMIDLLQVNTTTLNQHAKATKDNTKIDGVRVYSEQVLASRAA